MSVQPLLFTATSDFAGQMRGKAFPACELERRLVRGIGWTPTNVQITCFDSIAESPFGALGDLVLIPDPATEAAISFDPATPGGRFMIGDIRTLDGEAWSCCTRSILRLALDRLWRVGKVRLRAAFEHEFQFESNPDTGAGAYSLTGFEGRRQFGEALMAAIHAASLKPDTFMKEYGPSQYEVTIGPEAGLRAADAAVLVRELARATARSLGERVTFTPISGPGQIGNGVHVHLSLAGEDGTPALFDESEPHGLSKLGGAFAAGVLEHLESILALTAPADISYLRLLPHRWSTAFNNLGIRDREAALRICPVVAADPVGEARQFHLEYRAADGAASPYLALAAIVHAGCQGIEDELPTPIPTEEDLSVLTPRELAARGFRRHPGSLGEALECFERSEHIGRWFGDAVREVYRLHKRGELAFLDGMDESERCARYRAVY